YADARARVKNRDGLMAVLRPLFETKTSDEWMELDEADIVVKVMDDVQWALPNTRGLDPVAFRAVKEKRATFACTPGIDDLRPSAVRDGIRGGIDNLLLAGDWCDTGWPATMEGAVRSGYLAADGCSAFNGATKIRGLIPDVPPAGLARMLGL
ncbi:MAG: hypothetical protein EBY29_13950, partial [Planctomycetes bacterium]|nr:hypothetical protein [Planctomycetota bacterium]